MNKIAITKNEDGMRASKYLQKVFKTMPDSLLHKLIRKKYFELNDKKITGNELLRSGDILSIFLSEDTYKKFYNAKNVNEVELVRNDLIDKNIVYEDANIIIFNKPTGMLSQGDKTGDESVNTLLKNYVYSSKTNGLSDAFTPSIVNRLDRNTEGLIIFAKTYMAAKEISKMIKDNAIEKRYVTLVNGIVKEDSKELVNLYKKDEKNNKAIIKDYKESTPKGYTIIRLKYKVIKRYKDATELDIDLITGKSHQIRAQFSYIGHPIVCDKKYMDAKLYKENVARYGYKSQKLICYKIKFGKLDNEDLDYLSNKEFKIKANF